MVKLEEVTGDLVYLALQGHFDVIAHGCNCFCRMKSGIAPQLASAFGCDTFYLEGERFRGDINKLGQIESYERSFTKEGTFSERCTLHVVNMYTQYKIKKFNDTDYVYTTPDNPFDYQAFQLCLRKLNAKFAGKHIGLPRIGSKRAGGDWRLIRLLIGVELKDCRVTIVNYDKEDG